MSESAGESPSDDYVSPKYSSKTYGGTSNVSTTPCDCNKNSHDNSSSKQEDKKTDATQTVTRSSRFKY